MIKDLQESQRIDQSIHERVEVSAGHITYASITMSDGETRLGADPCYDRFKIILAFVSNYSVEITWSTRKVSSRFSPLVVLSIAVLKCDVE